MDVFFVLTLFCIFVAVQSFKTCKEEDIPVVSVIGYTGITTGSIFLFYPGRPMEIFCRGRTNQLILTRSTDPNPERNKWETVPTDTLNETTVRYQVEVESQVTFYICSDVTVECMSSFAIMVDNLPDFEDFHCISNNLNNVKCAWSSSNTVANFTLIEKRRGYITIVCEIPDVDFNKSMSCEWRTQSAVATTIDLVMKMCNYYRCRVKTYDINLYDILKLDPPRNLEVLEIGSHFVRLQWKRAVLRRFITIDKMDHKVEFWYAGMNFTSANTTSIKRDINTFQLALPLPCAEQSYEVRVSMKVPEAVGEEYWSQYTTTYFKTTKGHSVNVDPTCGKRMLRETPEFMRVKLEQLKDMIISEKTKILEKRREFKARAAKLNLN